MKNLDLSVYFVTDPELCKKRGVVETARAAVQGGATVVQLRDKTASDADLIALGKALVTALHDTPAQLIVNDRLAVAQSIGAGVHLGQSDLDPSVARQQLGAAAWIGVSVSTACHAAAVDLASVDYVGIGPVFATPTKPDHAQPLGIEGLAALCATTPLPAVAIGGLQAAHAAAVLAAGACGLAVVSAICGADHPSVAAHKLRTAVDTARSGRK